jgi:uncharacterized protein YpiB (UPF0302 family)
MEKKSFGLPMPELNAIDSLFAEMLLDSSLLDFRKKTIQQGIDQSLLDKNKEEFLRLTEELKRIS